MGRHSARFCVNGHDTHIFGRGSRSSCKECQRLFYHKVDKKQHHRISTCNKTWRTNGIINDLGEQFTYLDYDRMYQIQGGRCALCGKHSTEFKRNLAADHDHTTGKIRKLLCCLCNQTIVGANTIETAKRMIEYLREHADR